MRQPYFFTLQPPLLFQPCIWLKDDLAITWWWDPWALSILFLFFLFIFFSVFVNKLHYCLLHSKSIKIFSFQILSVSFHHIKLFWDKLLLYNQIFNMWSKFHILIILFWWVNINYQIFNFIPWTINITPSTNNSWSLYFLNLYFHSYLQNFNVIYLKKEFKKNNQNQR